MVGQTVDERLNVATTSICRLWLDTDGIGHVEYFPGARITAERLREQFEVAVRQCKGRKVAVLCDIRNVVSSDRDARRYYMSAEVVEHTKAAAILVGSPITRVMGNFFMGLYRTGYPVKVFTSGEAAHTWLRRFE